MMLEDPLNPESEMNRFVRESEIIFTIVFTGELALQVLAAGLIVPDPNVHRCADVRRGPVSLWSRRRADAVRRGGPRR